jgi:hypothetical protein
MNQKLKQHGLVILLALFLFWYLSPLFRSNVLASKPGDPYAHAAQLAWFCPNFFTQNFHFSQLFAPIGIDMSTSYEHPLLSTLTCLASSQGFIAQFNLLAAIQVTLVVFVSTWFARKYFHNSWIQVCFVFLYGFSTFTLARLTQHLNLITLVWAFPLIYGLFDQPKPNLKNQTIAYIAL